MLLLSTLRTNLLHTVKNFLSFWLILPKSVRTCLSARKTLRVATQQASIKRQPVRLPLMLAWFRVFLIRSNVKCRLVVVDNHTGAGAFGFANVFNLSIVYRDFAGGGSFAVTNSKPCSLQ